MIQRDVISDRIRQYILSQFPLASEQTLDDRTLLIEEGIVDSIGVLDIVTFIENEFRIQVDEDDIEAEQFASIEALVALVQEQLGRRSGRSSP